MWSDAFLWSDGYLWSDAYMWSSAYLWPDSVADDDPLYSSSTSGLTLADD